ncbi:MAG: hypothetical protein WC655_21365, partial [Candidatus Hydrogenedentales bacterium]
MADSPVNIEVKWFGPSVMRKLTAVTSTSNKKLALMMERQAKLNIREPFEHKDGENRSQIDTGAMINSTRAILAGGVDGALGSVTLPYGVDAMVMSPMEYSVYQESIRA